ncbi:Ligand-binding sensor domain-containing protein [Paucidesulfovibrio gracilis DSM 16080]|uniref:Ligand-binding sensor domain-containing protein n=1 Tax=Paucidesulfovibrio gracilis DSM 16080 TaxID=1121449 RepID=A0A1T4XNE1_9BACT|nr:PocR ligand-binding domain-containing protein [Paucidesulfovibrio gracilis]SKA91044.1 Ligand-binding sensor domain-containing protein [Paucidesulfovibrio gracilis DSM 16080]
MKITDLASTETWEGLEKELHEKFGLNASVADEQGVRITSYANWGNELCPRVKGDPKGLSAICAVAGKHFTQYCTSEQSPLVDECDACLTKIAVPVLKDGQYLGCAGGCGVLMEGEEVETFMVAKSLDMDEKEVQRLAETVPVISREKADEIVTYLWKRLQELGADVPQA